MEYMQCQEICKILKRRERESHKGTYGAAMLFAGSEGMMGAALLSARACMRSGLGLLTVHTAACGYTVLQLGIPEAKCERDASETHITRIEIPGMKTSAKADFFNQQPNCTEFSNQQSNNVESKQPAKTSSSQIQAVGIGPGIGKHKETAEALHKFLLSLSERNTVDKQTAVGRNNETGIVLPRLVLDADALNILSENPEWLRLLSEGTVLTPHPGEWKRLEIAIKSLDENDKAGLPRLIVIFKGAYTRVVDMNLSDGKVYAEWSNTEHGHSGMAVGGSGDTLTGIILSLLAQGYEPYDAARLGVYVHSLAADFALIKIPDTKEIEDANQTQSKEIIGKQSEESWLPSDLIENLGRAFTLIKTEKQLI